MSKGSRNRTNSKSFRDNFPLKGSFEPQWKKDLRKIKNENREKGS